MAVKCSEPMGQTVESLSCILRIQDNGEVVGCCELIMPNDRNSTGQPIMFISSKGFFNPLEYVAQVQQSVSSVLIELGRYGNIDSYDKYFDLLELRGMRSPSLVHWLPNGGLELVDREIADSKVRCLLADYYNRKWTMLVGSLLNSADKADLIAAALAQESMDEFLAIKLSQQITHRLTKYAKEITVPTIGDKIFSSHV